MCIRKILLFNLIILITIYNSNAQVNKRIALIKAFLKELREFKPQNYSKIKTVYLTEINPQMDSVMLNYILPQAQKDIAEKHSEKFSYKKYKEIRRKEQNLVIEKDMNINDVYVIEYGDAPYMFLLLSNNNDTIISFETLKKGNKRFFMLMK